MKKILGIALVSAVLAGGAFDKVCPLANGNQLDMVLATTFQETQGEIFRFRIGFRERICLFSQTLDLLL